MASKIRLFEKLPDGTLVQVHPDLADKVREGRRVALVASTEIEVLFTPEEEAEADERVRQHQASLVVPERTQTEKLEALLKLEGLSLDDLKAILKA